MRTKKTIFVLLLAAAACNPKPADKPAEAGSAKPAYAYTIEKPDNWDMQTDPANTSIALNALKAFEDNKIDESVSYFADTVHWRSDYADMVLSRDSLKAMVANFRNSYSSLHIDMHDFESVISKDKKVAYVTMWYVEKFTDKAGKTDSIATINDLKIQNGKITELDEAVRHFPVKK